MTSRPVNPQPHLSAGPDGRKNETSAECFKGHTAVTPGKRREGLQSQSEHSEDISDRKDLGLQNQQVESPLSDISTAIDTSLVESPTQTLDVYKALESSATQGNSSTSTICCKHQTGDKNKRKDEDLLQPKMKWSGQEGKYGICKGPVKRYVDLRRSSVRHSHKPHVRKKGGISLKSSVHKVPVTTSLMGHQPVAALLGGKHTEAPGKSSLEAAKKVGQPMAVSLDGRHPGTAKDSPEAAGKVEQYEQPHQLVIDVTPDLAATNVRSFPEDSRNKDGGVNPKELTEEPSLGGDICVICGIDILDADSVKEMVAYSQEYPGETLRVKENIPEVTPVAEGDSMSKGKITGDIQSSDDIQHFIQELAETDLGVCHGDQNGTILQGNSKSHSSLPKEARNSTDLEARETLGLEGAGPPGNSLGTFWEVSDEWNLAPPASKGQAIPVLITTRPDSSRPRDNTFLKNVKLTGTKPDTKEKQCRQKDDYLTEVPTKPADQKGSGDTCRPRTDGKQQNFPPVSGPSRDSGTKKDGIENTMVTRAPGTNTIVPRHQNAAEESLKSKDLPKDETTPRSTAGMPSGVPCLWENKSADINKNQQKRRPRKRRFSTPPRNDTISPKVQPSCNRRPDSQTGKVNEPDKLMTQGTNMEASCISRPDSQMGKVNEESLKSKDLPKEETTPRSTARMLSGVPCLGENKSGESADVNKRKQKRRPRKRRFSTPPRNDTTSTKVQPSCISRPDSQMGKVNEESLKSEDLPKDETTPRSTAVMPYGVPCLWENKSADINKNKQKRRPRKRRFSTPPRNDTTSPKVQPSCNRRPDSQMGKVNEESLKSKDLPKEETTPRSTAGMPSGVPCLGENKSGESADVNKSKQKRRPRKRRFSTPPRNDTISPKVQPSCNRRPDSQTGKVNEESLKSEDLPKDETTPRSTAGMQSGVPCLWDTHKLGDSAHVNKNKRKRRTRKSRFRTPRRNDTTSPKVIGKVNEPDKLTTQGANKEADDTQRDHIRATGQLQHRKKDMVSNVT